MSPSKLFTPLTLGKIGNMRHRVVLAPLTRNRAAEPTLSPSDLTAQYYRQRASAGGLIITEATNISPESLAYPSTPGIWNSEQVEGWQRVTQAVHDNSGFIVCQLWHTGRVAHPSYGNHPCNARLQYTPCVSSSATQIVNSKGRPGKTVTYDGIAEHGVPRELSANDDIPRLLKDYQRAAKNAKASGFDGVEIHAAHGYLIDQFLNNGVNKRTDQYGGSATNRCRLLKEVVEAVLEIWPADRVGVRLSPHDAPNGGNTYYGCKDDNPDEVYSAAVTLLNSYNLAYLLMTEPRWVGKYDDSPETDPGFQAPLRNLQTFRHLYQGALIGAGGFTPTSSYEAMQGESVEYDAVAFGRWFIANPDLPLRLQQWHAHLANDKKGNRPQPAALNRYERDTFYTQGPSGYIDYPSLEFENSGAGSSNKVEFDGMQKGKYALVEQGSVGTSLKGSSLQSKL